MAILILKLQTGLGDPSSDVPSSPTSVIVLAGTDLPNEFLLLCIILCKMTHFIKGEVHCVRTAGQIFTQKAPR